MGGVAGVGLRGGGRGLGRWRGGGLSDSEARFMRLCEESVESLSPKCR